MEEGAHIHRHEAVIVLGAVEEAHYAKTLRVTLPRVGSSTRFSIIQDTSNKAPLILLPTFEQSFAFPIKPSVLQLEKSQSVVLQ